MVAISLECPNCIQRIEIDEKKEYGYCVHCGYKVIVKDIDRGPVDQAAKINEWMSTVKEAHRSGDRLKCEEYSKKILALDDKQGLAWFFKGCAASRDVGRFYEALDDWARASKFMSLDERREYYHEFLYELASYDETGKIILSKGFNMKKMKEDAKNAVKTYVSGFDADSLCSMLYDGACFLKDESENVKTDRYETMLESAEIMLHYSLSFDKDITSILRTYNKKLEIAKRSKERTINDYKYEATSLRLLLMTRKIRKSDDIFIEYYSNICNMLSRIVLTTTEEQRAKVKEYWSDEKNKAEAEGIYKRRIEAENNYFTAIMKHKSVSASKRSAMEALDAVFRETAFPASMCAGAVTLF